MGQITCLYCDLNFQWNNCEWSEPLIHRDIDRDNGTVQTRTKLACCCCCRCNLHKNSIKLEVAFFLLKHQCSQWTHPAGPHQQAPGMTFLTLCSPDLKHFLTVLTYFTVQYSQWNSKQLVCRMFLDLHRSQKNGRRLTVLSAKWVRASTTLHALTLWFYYLSVHINAHQRERCKITADFNKPMKRKMLNGEGLGHRCRDNLLGIV